MGRKFTPGPWAYDQDSGEVYFNDGDVSPRIATIDDNWIDEAQGHADGVLIAEAPAMLAILRQMLDQARGNPGKPMPDVLIGQALLLVGRIDCPTFADRASDEVFLLYGATFTLSIGYNHTHLHTQSGSLADPVECLRKAIGALTDEMARVQRCPRQRALAHNDKTSGKL